MEEEIKTWKDKMIFANIFPIFIDKNSKFGFKALCVYKIKTKTEFNISQIPLAVDNHKFNTKFLFKKGIKIPFLKIYINYYKATCNTEELKDLQINNRVCFELKEGDETYEVPLLYNAIYLKKTRFNHGKVHFYDDINMSLYFRQSMKNSLNLTLRKTNITDRKETIKKLNLAKFLSLFPFNKKIILLFEKELNWYGESAAVLYEKLIDNGYKNIYYVINKSSNQYELINEKYKSNIIEAYTFKHFYYLFKCKTFIGTEAIQHVLELRTNHPAAMRKLNDKNINYIFLQHGITYMVSLAAKTRDFFRDGVRKYKFHKVIVSSKKEANHFIEAGEYDKKNLYMCGIPKFDKLRRNDNANKIIIMPTWRQWEYNQVRLNFEETGYYKMLMTIYNSIPNNLKKDVQILPHPLILEALKKTKINKYIPEFRAYSELIENCSLLITDYSSISYSAFHVGANIIFYWKDKEECEKKYEGEVVLKREEAFGDVCYNEQEIKKSIEKLYLKNQPEEYKKNYKTIVEFDDNKNTERLIEFLKKDKIL